MTYLKTLFLLLILPFSLFGQSGNIRGTVYDAVTGEVLFGVTVMAVETSTGAITDFDGKYDLKIAPGEYSLQFSFVSYTTIVVQNVVVKSGEVNILDVNLKEAVSELEEVVITAEAIRSTEEALLNVKRKSANLLDGISSANFRKIGDGDAASAVKRVPGVSIEGGKYVYVRGLGDRYTKSILNGMDIPGLDPDRNTLQMDIFPTNILDNIIVLKSFTADLYADFTGGIVDIATKNFPETKTLNISGGFGFNPSMHFNSNFLTYNGGATDWLGFDDGSRNIPTAGMENIPFRTDAIIDPNGAGQVYNQVLRDFNPNMTALRSNSFMDYSVGLTAGDQVAKNKLTLGYNFSLNYKSSTTFYKDAIYSRFGKSSRKDVFEMDQREFQKGDIGRSDALVSAMAGFALKTEKSKIIINGLRLQNAESTAAIFDYEGSDLGANFTAFQHNLDFSERSMSNLLINGTHYFNNANWELDWKLSPTKSVLNDPDIRFTRYRTDGTNLDILTIGTESGIPERIWRWLDETSYVGRVDLTRKYDLFFKPAKLKFGTGSSFKERDYNIENFQIFTGNTSLTGNPDELFFTENLFSRENRNGVYYDPQFIPFNPNQYSATIQNTFLYLSNEAILAQGLKSIVGVRAEKYVQRYTGINQAGDVFDNEVVLDNLDFFPTVNLIYEVGSKQNIRASFARTIARPSFKEASFAEILDPLTGRTFIGGFFTDIDLTTGEQVWDGNLVKTDINNFDLRWEAFQSAGQMYSVSAFYKMFINPIEMVQFLQAVSNFQPRNVGDGQVVGLEFEFRQNLNFISPKFEKFSLNGNYTLTRSRIDLSETEYNSRLLSARDGQQVKRYRNMAGQAPYIVNIGIGFNDSEKFIDAGLFYNVQGSTLLFVGMADNPDIFTVPFHSLNFNANKSIGADRRINISLKVDNILGDDREEVFKSFRAQDQLFTQFSPERRVSIGFSYSLR